MRVIHEFIDNEGRTQFDEFNSNLPLDMGDIPQVAHVLLMLRSNARRIAELWKECDDGIGRKRLYIGCPSPGLPKMGDWAEAKNRVRELCFENPNPIYGGLRAARITDYTNARVVAMAHEIHRNIVRAVDDLPEDQRTDFQKLKLTRQQYVAANQGEIVSTMSAHPLWKRVSWIADLDLLAVFNFIGILVDPTWYVHPEDPARCGLFKERCGLYNPVEALQGESVYTGAFLSLATPFLTFFRKTRKIKLEELRDPKFFFLRYAFRWMQHYADNNEDAPNAFVGGVWRYVQKLANFIWLSWMESTHESVPVNFDEERFFFGAKDVASTAYKAVVS